MMIANSGHVKIRIYSASSYSKTGRDFYEHEIFAGVEVVADSEVSLDLMRTLYFYEEAEKSPPVCY